jgi:hypothetical protein
MAWTIVALALFAFRTLMLDGFPLPPPPPPPEMEHSPGPSEQLFSFMLAYLLLLAVILLVLPKRWSSPIIEVAFHLPKKDKHA